MAEDETDTGGGTSGRHSRTDHGDDGRGVGSDGSGGPGSGSGSESDSSEVTTTSGTGRGASGTDPGETGAGETGAGETGAGESITAASSDGSSSRASEAFAAGRAARDGSSSSGDEPAGGPSEAPTVEQSRPAATEVMTTGSANTPTTVQSRPGPPPQQAQARPARSGPSAVGGALRRVLGLLATLVTIVGLLAAAVLVVFIVLRVVAINPQNGVAQAVEAIADRLVGAFRDLFLIPDPVVVLVVNYGLAAVAWIVVTVIVARVLRAIGRAMP